MLQALMLKGYEGEGPNFIPLPDAKLILAQERRGARQALGLALETAMDAGGLEDENRELCRQIAEQMVRVCGFDWVYTYCVMSYNAYTVRQRVLREKEAALAEEMSKNHEMHKDRILLLTKNQDLEMDNADLKLVMQKTHQAEVRPIGGWCV